MVTFFLAVFVDSSPPQVTGDNVKTNWSVLRRYFVALPGYKVPESLGPDSDVKTYKSEAALVETTNAGNDLNATEANKLQYLSITTPKTNEKQLIKARRFASDSTPYLVGVAVQNFVMTMQVYIQQQKLQDDGQKLNTYAPGRVTQLLVLEAIPGLVYHQWARHYAVKGSSQLGDGLKAFWVLLAFSSAAYMYSYEETKGMRTAVFVLTFCTLAGQLVTSLLYAANYHGSYDEKKTKTEKDPMQLCDKGCPDTTRFRARLVSVVTAYALMLMAAVTIVSSIKLAPAMKLGLKGLISFSPIWMLWVTHQVADDDTLSLEGLNLVGAVLSSMVVLPVTTALRSKWLFQPITNYVEDSLVSYGAIVATALVLGVIGQESMAR